MSNKLIKGFIAAAGFTLIELLVVIAILGIIIAAVVAGIDPIDKINAANDAKVQSDIGSIGTAFEANATMNSGTYAVGLAALTTSGDLKATLTPPSGYVANYGIICTSGTCATQGVYANLKSKKFTGGATTTGFYWKWCSVNGRVGSATTTSCP
jgi:prepilin-type N-terminal cleavage/methylation domain-containing protein